MVSFYRVRCTGARADISPQRTNISMRSGVSSLDLAPPENVTLTFLL